MKEQRHESFRTDSGRMEESVAEFLPAKMSEEWIVKRCSCRETTPGDTNTWVGCMFEGEKPIQGF